MSSNDSNEKSSIDALEDVDIRDPDIRVDHARAKKKELGDVTVTVKEARNGVFSDRQILMTVFHLMSVRLKLRLQPPLPKVEQTLGQGARLLSMHVSFYIRRRQFLT